MGATANPVRGEMTFDLDGADYVLRPSFEAIVAIEEQTGKTQVELAQMASDGRLTVMDAAVVVTECIKAQGRALLAAGQDDQRMTAFNKKTVGELIQSSPGGVVLATQKLALLLFMAASGGYTPKGEVKAARMTS